MELWVLTVWIKSRYFAASEDIPEDYDVQEVRDTSI